MDWRAQCQPELRSIVPESFRNPIRQEQEWFRMCQAGDREGRTFMAYDQALASRVRKLLDGVGRIEEKPMFGGLTFMLDGKMCCGVEKTRLMVRIRPERHDEFLAKPGAKPMDFTGRPMRGFLFVDGQALRGPALSSWIREAVTYVKSKPAKKR